MSDYTSLYEIIIADDGVVSLKKVGDENDEPLVSIQFSEQAKYFLGSDHSEVARAMIEAGLDAVSDLQACSGEEGLTGLDAMDESDPVLH